MWEIRGKLETWWWRDGLRTRSTTTRDRNLQFRGAVSTGFFFVNFLRWIFPFLQVDCNLIRKSPQNVEKLPQFPGGEKEWNPGTSLAVMVFSVPKFSGFSKHAFREVPFGFRRGTVPGATLVPPRPQECPKISPEERTWYQPRRHVCILRSLLRSASQEVQRDRSRDSPFPPEKVLKTYLVPGWKARLSA